MVEKKYRDVLLRILELLDTAYQASLELLIYYKKSDMLSVRQILTDLWAVTNTVSIAQEPFRLQLQYGYTSEMLENIEDTLNDIEHSINIGNAQRAAMKIEFQLFPFLRLLREGFYFWGMVYPDQEKMEEYYQTEFAAHYQNYDPCEENPPLFDMSIIVTAYNHLDTTKYCVEQILKETDLKKLCAELIFIDHGSTDGTLEYFENLGIGKVIHFKRNVRMYMFASMFLVCRGKYFAHVDNDVLVTKDWAEILLRCMESDPEIIAAVPATPNIANLQMLNIPTNNPSEFIAWAGIHNHSDPALWDDRVRLMPPLGMYRVETVNRIGFADPYFYSMEFWDDDFSFRARRAGYRQIVCGDVSCYHFGSMTNRTVQKQEGTLAFGRTLFQKKNQIDAWENGFCYDYQAVCLLKQVLPTNGDIAVLGLDCGMGDTPLQIRNELRRRHQECILYQLASQEEYFPDIQPHCEHTGVFSKLSTGVKEAFGIQQFHAIYLGRDIGQYDNYMQLLEESAHRLFSGGHMVFSCANPFYALTVHALLQFTMPTGYSEQRYVLVDPERVRQTAERYFSQVQVVALEQSIDGLKEFAVQHFGKTSEMPQIVKRLEIRQYYFVCQR